MRTKDTTWTRPTLQHVVSATQCIALRRGPDVWRQLRAAGRILLGWALRIFAMWAKVNAVRVRASLLFAGRDLRRDGGPASLLCPVQPARPLARGRACAVGTDVRIAPRPPTTRPRHICPRRARPMLRSCNVAASPRRRAALLQRRMLQRRSDACCSVATLHDAALRTGTMRSCRS